MAQSPWSVHGSFVISELCRSQQAEIRKGAGNLLAKSRVPATHWQQEHLRPLSPARSEILSDTFLILSNHLEVFSWVVWTSLPLTGEVTRDLQRLYNLCLRFSWWQLHNWAGSSAGLLHCIPLDFREHTEKSQAPAHEYRDFFSSSKSTLAFWPL